MLNNIKRVYNLLGDAESKDIFILRLLWSITGDEKYIDQMYQYQRARLISNAKVKTILNNTKKILDNKNIVVYGIGALGKRVIDTIEEFLPEVKIAALCDRKVDEVSSFSGYEVMTIEKLCDEYSECMVLVSPKYYQQEVKNSLLLHGIKEENIVLVYEHPILQQFMSIEIYNQYFDELVEFKDGEIFVDAGCLDCSTSFEFIEKCPNYTKIYALEPEEENFKKCKKIIEQSNYKDIQLLNYGLWNKEDILHFCSNHGSSRISECGECQIRVKRLDDILQGERVTYIKMDIEGAELNALEGTAQTLREWKPNLAISVYHKVDDFVKIPLFIDNLEVGYKLYLRHYKRANEETVLYAIKG